MKSPPTPVDPRELPSIRLVWSEPAPPQVVCRDCRGPLLTRELERGACELCRPNLHRSEK